MPRGQPPPWSQKDCTWDHLVAAAINAGAGTPVIYHGIEDPDRAAEIRRGVYRCGRHREVSVQVTWPHHGVMTSKSAQWPPDKNEDGTYSLTILIFDKRHGRKHLVTTMGTDRNQWHYNPRKKSS